MAVTSKYTTHDAAERNDGPLFDQRKRALLVWRNNGDATAVDLAGFRLTRTEIKSWRVTPRDHDGEDREFVDEFDCNEFPSARYLLSYLESLRKIENEAKKPDGGDVEEEFPPRDSHRVI